MKLYLPPMLVLLRTLQRSQWPLIMWLVLAELLFLQPCSLKHEHWHFFPGNVIRHVGCHSVLKPKLNVFAWCINLVITYFSHDRKSTCLLSVKWVKVHLEQQSLHHVINALTIKVPLFCSSKPLITYWGRYWWHHACACILAVCTACCHYCEVMW